MGGGGGETEAARTEGQDPKWLRQPDSSMLSFVGKGIKGFFCSPPPGHRPGTSVQFCSQHEGLSLVALRLSGALATWGQQAPLCLSLAGAPASHSHMKQCCAVLSSREPVLGKPRVPAGWDVSGSPLTRGSSKGKPSRWGTGPGVRDLGCLPGHHPGPSVLLRHLPPPWSLW